MGMVIHLHSIDNTTLHTPDHDSQSILFKVFKPKTPS